MEYPKLIAPEKGRTYKNRNGGTYRCIDVIDPETAWLFREPDGWTLIAHRVRQYEDGTIEWDASTGGHWPDGRPLVRPGAVTAKKPGKPT